MRIRSFIQSFLWLALLLVVTSNVALAQIPREMSYQGIIVDGSGNPISDGNHSLEVSFYDLPVGGTLLHGETFFTQFKAGIFNVILGRSTPFPAGLQFDKQYFLAVSVDGGAEMVPRTALTSAPYAIRAGSADVAKSVSSDARGVVTSLNELDGPVRIIGDTTIRVTQNGQVISLSAIIPDMKGVPFNLITSGINTGQTLVVGDSTKLYPQGKGEITANRLTGASFTVNSNADSYAGRVKIPKGVASLTINVNPSVGCTANSSVTVSQFDTEGSEILVGTMVTRIINNSFTVQFSAAYPSDTGQITYLIVNP
ncbi:MAG TPA: hypothetical protein VIX80_07300 [Candidatus Kapabacteria bacterium]